MVFDFLVLIDSAVKNVDYRESFSNALEYTNWIDILKHVLMDILLLVVHDVQLVYDVK